MPYSQGRTIPITQHTNQSSAVSQSVFEGFFDKLLRNFFIFVAHKTPSPSLLAVFTITSTSSYCLLTRRVISSFKASSEPLWHFPGFFGNVDFYTHDQHLDLLAEYTSLIAVKYIQCMSGVHAF